MIEEIGEEGYNHLKDTLGFGDIIENGHVSEDNSRRVSIVVKARGHSINCTNGEGLFWDLVFDFGTKIKVHGNVLNDEFNKIKQKYGH